MSENTLFLLDAYALAYRAHYAFIKNPRINSKGMNTSAVFGFTNTLLEILAKENPSHIGVVFDPSGPNFRHEMYPEYKANREAMPEDMRQAIPYIKDVIKALNIPVVQVQGFEADDVIGTLAFKAKEQGLTVYMMTPDKDYAQLVTDGIYVYKPGRAGDDIEIWDAAKVKEKFSVSPDKIIDLLGLMGDSSDNIPGCPGVGPKGAEKMLADFGSLEGVYENIDKLKGKQKENMLAFRDQIELSKKLATIDTHVPVVFYTDEYKREAPNEQRITQLFNELEFKTLINKLLKLTTKPIIQHKPTQGLLFDFGSESQVENHVNTLKDIHSEKPDYKVAQTIEEQELLLKNLMKCNEVCFDTETTSLDTHSAKLVAISFSMVKGEAWLVPVPEDDEQAQAITDRFRPFFEDEKILKIGQNIKYDMLVLMNYGIEVRGKLFDTMVAHYLIQPELRHNLDYLAESYLQYRTIATEELIGKKGKGQQTMRQVELEKLRDYACEDADITFQLKPFLEAELKKSNMLSLFYNIETPLIPVLAHMEFYGVKINIIALNEYAVTLRSDIIKAEQSIYEQAGMEFNISSPKQLGEVLFDRMKIVDNPSMTKTKQYSTAEDILEKLQDKHPIIRTILEYRSLKKLLSTYVEALPELVHPKTGRIHTSYNQTIASTGRLSSNNPNLQNIPVRDARGREIRKAFIANDNNYCIISADYSQIELRLMAHFSQDQDMIDAFKNGLDIHAATAAKLFRTTPDLVTREQRSKAKGANFGIIYGISSFGLSQNLSISRTEAKEIIDSYFTSYPDVKTFMDKSIAMARQKGYAETLFSRRRYLPDLQSVNSLTRSAAERNAINAPIQGTAADIIKVAMIGIHREFNAKGLKSVMMMQVHDELIFDVLNSELEIVKQIIKDQMENAVILKVPLLTDLGVGQNWLEAH
jgi:DNA polymerase I